MGCQSNNCGCGRNNCRYCGGPSVQANLVKPGTPLFNVGGTAGSGATMTAADQMIFRSPKNTVDVGVKPGSVVIDIDFQDNITRQQIGL